jgi:hypothetical protein
MAMTYDSLLAYINGLHEDGTLSDTDFNKIILYILANGNTENSPRDLIQVRRGNRLNLPHLAQGELGWCMDDEELYIGSTLNNVLISKTRQIIVTAYGVRGDYDGTSGTDNTAALQAIIDDLTGDENVTILFPKGTYRITGKITVNKPNITTQGEDAVIMYDFNNSNNHLFFVTHTSNITFDNIIINADASLPRRDAAAYIMIDASDYVTVKNCTMINCQCANVWCINNSGYGKIIDNTFKDSKADGIHLTEGSHHYYVGHNHILNPGDDGISNVWYGDVPNPPHDNLIANNIITGTITVGSGITCWQSHRICAFNNVIDGKYHGMVLTKYPGEYDRWRTEGRRAE